MTLVGKRPVECPVCGTADVRYDGLIAMFFSAQARSYRDHCRACGAHLSFDRSKDWPRIAQADAVLTLYFMNAFVWAVLWIVILIVPIANIWDINHRQYPVLAAMLFGAGWGLWRARKASKRGEMFQRKRSEPVIDIDAP